MTRRFNTRSRSIAARRWLPAAALLVAVAVGVGAGCSSDDPNRLGGALVDPEFSEVLEVLSIEDLSAYSALTVNDANLPLNRVQTLYLGDQDGTSSVILADYDFADIFSEDYPETLFTDEKIKKVWLSLTMVKFYGEPNDGGEAAQLSYNVHELTAPFDTTDVYPGPVPDFGPRFLNTNFTEVQGKEPQLDLLEIDLLRWLDDGAKVGMMVKAGVGSDSVLVGFASRELTRYDQLEDVAVGTVVAPNLVVEFEDISIPNFLLAPYADTSTFHTVAPPPAAATDGLLLRTGLRNYPALMFDFSPLPRNAFINRALLRVVNDTTKAFGNLETIVASELDATWFGDPFAEIELSDLVDEVYTITGRKSLDPYLDTVVAFDVTAAVQRIVNQVYVGQRGLVLTAGEDAFSSYDLSITDPEFYFTEFAFHGTAAADSLRPRLEITYSRISELEGGGE